MRLLSSGAVTYFVLTFVTTVTTAQEVLLTYTVREQRERSTDVGNIAIDSRLYDNVTNEEFNRMRFQLLTEGNQYALLFKVDKYTSQLQTDDVLDREVICPEGPDCILDFNVAVYLKDEVTDLLDLFIIIPISVTLTDINDNAPTFPSQEITIPIKENSNVNEEYFTYGAIDLDTGLNNSVQRYFMEPPNEMFGLHVLKNDDGSSDLNIVVKYPLDRESRSFYQLVVYAVDGGDPVRTGSVKINITITDQNDNSPIFSEPVYNITINENPLLNTTILTLNATDTDEADNGLVSYQFASRTSSKIKQFFSVNSSTGALVVIDVLDYEEDQKFTFQVEAYDNGSPASKSAKVDVIINIRDLNDNSPQININLPPGTISEAAEVGSYVAHMSVFDRDNGANGQVTCKVLGNEFRLEKFRIENNYKVLLNQPLDYEVTDRHEVRIECQDGGTPPNKNSTVFVISVEDFNDNYPIFSQLEYEVAIQEETLQYSIVQVRATDKDSGPLGNVSYRLLPNASSVFNINSQTGLLTANAEFDREELPDGIRLPVLAIDDGKPRLTSTATVILNISDINDNSPQFPSQPVRLQINENQEGQTVSLNVTDPDDGPNGKFILSFPRNDYLDKYLRFNAETGEITAKEALDREKIPFFKFSVTAVDGGIPQRSSTAEVIIEVQDDNDNIPAITFPNNFNRTMFVQISAPVGQFITAVEAHDDDQGVNAQLLYFIDRGNSRQLFHMDVNSGVVSVGKAMGPKDAAEYKLDIAVRDNGVTQRTSFAKLIVVVQLTNDTALPASVEEEGKRNIMIVIIFVALTVVLSFGILATIFVLRHIDRQGCSSHNPKPEDSSKYYEATKVDESLSASSNMSKDSDAELLKRKAKKEVSFSMDDESEPTNNSTLTNVTSFTTVKTMPSYMSMDYKPEESQCSSWMCNTSTDVSKTLPDQYSEKDPSFSSLSQSQLQKALHQLHHPGDSSWLQQGHEGQTKQLIAMLKKAEDANSEASAETSTSDSGRGGSEEDIHSNRGHTLSDSDEGRQYYHGQNSRHQRFSDNKAPPARRRPPPPIPTESYPRNISFSDDSVTANTTVASFKHPGQMPSYTDFKTPIRQPGQGELFSISGRTPRDTFLDTQMTTPGFAYSLADIDDVSEMANTRDDASTTTSGSYTINPDELCNEIDELFFKDVIV